MTAANATYTGASPTPEACMRIDDLVHFDSPPPAGESFATDPSRVEHGAPRQTVWNRYSSPCGRFSSGEWECTPGRWRVQYSEFEYCEILAGESVLHDEHGGRRHLRPGDRFVLPAGFRGSWEVLSTCRKIYVIYEA